MSGSRLELRVEVDLGADADTAEVDEQALLLRADLLELDVDSVERPSAGPAPEGARAVDAIELGTLLVELTTGMIVPVVHSIRAWVARRQTRSVKLTLDGDSIELSNASDSEQQQILEAFFARHVSAAG
jgi:hypothetical protein